MTTLGRVTGYLGDLGEHCILNETEMVRTREKDDFKNENRLQHNQIETEKILRKGKSMKNN